MNFWLPKSKRFYRCLAAAGLGWALWLGPGFGLGCAWSQASYFFHEIQPGETLWAIAKAYGISVERLQEFNGGLEGSSHIKAGEFLIVPADVLERPQPPVVKRPQGQGGSEGGELAVRPGSVFGTDGPDNSADDDAPPGLVELAPPEPELALVSPIEADKAQARPAAQPPAAPAGNKGAAASGKTSAAQPQSGNKDKSIKPASKPQAKPSASAQSKAADAQAGKSSAAKPQAADAKSGKSASSKSSGAKSGQNASASSQAKQERPWSRARAQDSKDNKDSKKAQSKDKSSSSDKKKDSELALNTAPSASQTVSGGRWRRGQAPKENKGRDKSGKDEQQAQKTPEEMVAFAKKFLGTPYVYGGDTPAGFDCSGFVQSVCRYAGVNIPRVADDQYYRAGKPVPKGKEREGDLVFFETDPSWPGPSHVGICVGNGEFIHASSSGSVRIDSLDKEYYKARFLGSKRVLEG